MCRVLDLHGKKEREIIEKLKSNVCGPIVFPQIGLSSKMYSFRFIVRAC